MLDVVDGLVEQVGDVRVVQVDKFAGLGCGDGSPGVPGDLEDDEGDGEADERVADVGASATTIALATTLRETNPSMRAWLPSAISAGLERRRPPRSLTCAAISLPIRPTMPAVASTHRWVSWCGWMRRRIVS